MSMLRWICETCKGYHLCEGDIWDCPCCGVETCESCFGSFAHCVNCSRGMLDLVLINSANIKCWDFELDSNANDRDTGRR